MEDLENQALATAPDHCIPILWKSYVDNILEIKKIGSTQLTDHLNSIDKTCNIKFTQKEKTIAFLD